MAYYDRVRVKTNANTAIYTLIIYPDETSILEPQPGIKDICTMQDSVNPQFHLYQRLGLSQPSYDCALTADLYETQSGSMQRIGPEGQLAFTLTGNLTERWIYYSGWSPPPLSVSPNLYQKATIQALGNVDAPRAAFGEDFAELGKTLKYIKNPLKSLTELGKSYQRDKTRIYHDYRKRARFHKNSEKRQLRKRDKAYANLWLEYRFAATPLVRSISDALDVYANKDKEPPWLENARGFAKDSDRFSGYWQDGVDYEIGVDITSSLKRDVKATIAYTVDNPCQGVGKLLGTRVRDLPETFWAVMPYSFLVDRVFDVSAAMAAVRALSTPGLSILKAFVTTYEKAEELKRLSWFPEASGWYYTVADTNQINSEMVNYRRDIWEPSYVNAIPAFTPLGLLDSAKDIADLAALAIQRWR